jgi:hypothetical protein
MQGEVIKSLQMAVQYDNAVVNLTMLYEASITNRKATFVTLDQLKQRLLPRMPINRQLQGGSNPSSSRLSSTSFATTGMSTFDPTRYVPDNYVPPAVTLTPRQDVQGSDRGLAKYIRESKRNSNMEKESAPAQSRQSQASDDINFSQAFQHLLNTRGTDNRATIMREIDEIMDSFQGLQTSPKQSDPWNNSPSTYGYDGRRESHYRLSAQDPYSRDPLTPTRESLQMPKNMPPTPEEPGSRAYAPPPPAFNHGIFDRQNEQLKYHQQYAAKNPYPQMQTQGLNQPRWSTTSGTSSNYSDAQSLERNSSTSSQESRTQNVHAHTAHTQNSHIQNPHTQNMHMQNSHTQNPHLPLHHSSPPLPQDHSPHNQMLPRNPPSPEAQFQYHDYQNFYQPTEAIQDQPTSYHPYSPTASFAPSSPQNPRGQPTASPYITPQPPREDHNSLLYSPYATNPYQQPHSQSPAPLSPTQQQPYLDDDMNPNRPRYHLLPEVARRPPPIPPIPHSSGPSSERTITQAVLPASTLGTAPAIAGLRHSSIAPSISSIGSTDSSASVPNGLRKPMRTGSIQSPPPGVAQTGRPCKANNYWGFCKGSYEIRENPKKGLNLRTQPLGMYATREIWECTACTFKGATFTAPHPTKKNKEITVVDSRVYTSKSGIKYKWIFLAKSHVKKKAVDSHMDESNYGCVFCSLQDEVSSVYGGVETLMNHIATVHVHGATKMSDGVCNKAKAVVGRNPAKDEEWDVWAPGGEGVGELP